MSVLKNLLGHRFGRLLVIERAANASSGQARWKCKCDCGEIRIVMGAALSRKYTTSCGCFRKDVGRTRKREKAHNWKGGKHTDLSGYVFIYEPEHPNAMVGGYVLEHIKVITLSIGRPLEAKETVHHINGVRSDNRRIENLELWASDHPPGQRVEDLVIHAFQILNKYQEIVKKLSNTKGA